MFLNKKDVDSFKGFGFLEKDIDRLRLEVKQILLEQNDDYLDHIKDQEDSNFDRSLNK